MAAPLPAPEGVPTTLAVLRRARELLTPPERWCQQALYTGDPTAPERMCMMGALHLAASGTADWSGSRLSVPAENAVRTVIGDTIIARWNNARGRRHADILAALDTAIAAEVQQ